MSELFVWQVFEGGEWGTIAADGMPLVARSWGVTQLLGLAAVAHHDRTGLPVRLARFDLGEVLRSVP